jgi:hypothetical protein
MRHRHRLAASATIALVVALLVLATVAGGAADARSLHEPSTTDVAVPAADLIAHASFTSTPVASPRVSLLGAELVVYLAPVLSAALALAFWTALGISSRSLITRPGLSRRRRAPPLAGS